MQHKELAVQVEQAPLALCYPLLVELVVSVYQVAVELEVLAPAVILIVSAKSVAQEEQKLIERGMAVIRKWAMVPTYWEVPLLVMLVSLMEVLAQADTGVLPRIEGVVQARMAS